MAWGGVVRLAWIAVIDTAACPGTDFYTAKAPAFKELADLVFMFIVCVPRCAHWKPVNSVPFDRQAYLFRFPFVVFVWHFLALGFGYLLASPISTSACNLLQVSRLHDSCFPHNSLMCVNI